MTVALFTLATAMIAAVVSYIVGLNTSRAQARLEYEKWRRARQDEVNRDIRVALGEVASGLAELAHAVMSFTYATPDHGSPGEKAIQSYNEETHRLISRVVGSQVRLAALDRAEYERITPLVSEAIKLSEDVDDALKLLKKNRDRGGEAIPKCNLDALEYIKALPQEFANLIGDKDKTLRPPSGASPE